jgi:hypothetical protein
MAHQIQGIGMPPSFADADAVPSMKACPTSEVLGEDTVWVSGSKTGGLRSPST